MSTERHDGDAEIVHGEPTQRASHAVRRRPWRWTPRKRKAMVRVARGWTDVAVAAYLGVHRNTVRHWRRRPEFIAAVARRARDATMRTRMRRLHQTGAALDRLVGVIAERLCESSTDLGARTTDELRVCLTEYAALRDSERLDLAAVAAIESGAI